MTNLYTSSVPGVVPRIPQSPSLSCLVHRPDQTRPDRREGVISNCGCFHCHCQYCHLVAHVLPTGRIHVHLQWNRVVVCRWRSAKHETNRNVMNRDYLPIHWRCDEDEVLLRHTVVVHYYSGYKRADLLVCRDRVCDMEEAVLRAARIIIVNSRRRRRRGGMLSEQRSGSD